MSAQAAWRALLQAASAHTGAPASHAMQRRALAWLAAGPSSSSSTSRSASALLGWRAQASKHAAAAHSRRGLATGFTPSRLYPKQAGWTPEALAVMGLVGTNLAAALLAKSEVPDARAFVRRHLLASVEALYEGRWHTLATAAVSHLSLVHLAINLGVLLAFRRVAQLSAAETLWLYLLGGVVGSVGHVAWHWYDAGGPEFGPLYAANTPAYCGCSGAVAATLAYKLALEPGAIRLLLVLPLPLLLVAVGFDAMEVKEVEYSDGPPARLAGSAAGFAAAMLAMMRGSRKPIWMGGRRSMPPGQPL